MRTARPFLRDLGARVGSSLLKLSAAGTRMSWLGLEHEREALAGHGSAIYAVWHGRFWLPVAVMGARGLAVMVSLSEDGEVIAKAAARLGYVPVRGSSSRGGREGLAAMTDVLEGGRSVALTPDGPRGPRHQARMGTLVLASRSGKPILPVGAASNPAWEARSWDRFQIPYPGSRATVAFGEPLFVPAVAELDAWRPRLEQALNAVQETAEQAVGK